MKKMLPLLLVLFSFQLVLAQDKSYEVKRANANDVSSTDSIIAALYDVISGEAGVKRDWERFKSLWYPGANLTMVTPTTNGASKQITMGLDEFIKLSSNHSSRNSFYEIEINSKSDKIGHMASVVSTYVIKNDPNAKEAQIRGVNIFQLYFDGNRWWILNCIWENEVQGMQIPEDYLPSN
jgi:hypothetical protein